MNKFAYGLPKDLYKGMRVRPSMDMIVNYIEKDPYKIKYPNRDATFYLNSPQFLNLLNDSGLDLDEQSKNQAKHQLMLAQARAGGRGGAVDLATDSEADEYMSASSEGSSSYRRRVTEELNRMREQERIRRENEDYLRRQQEALDKANELQRQRAMELARQAASSSSAHPVASSAAASSPSISPEMMQAMFASVLLQQQRQQTPLITYLNPGSGDSQGITPIIPQRIYQGASSASGSALVPASSSRYSENEDATKRARVEPKAKAEPASGASSSSTPSIPAKTRADLDREEEWRLKKELKELLSSAEYNVDDIRKKFRDKYPGVRRVGDKALSSAKKKDIIEEYINRIKGSRDVRGSISGVKEELRTRRSAVSAPAS